MPPRDGLGPARLRVHGGPLGDELATRFGPEVTAKVMAGQVVDQDGAVLDASTVLPAGSRVYFYRELRDEVPVPFDIPVLYHDDDIVVVDKPHPPRVREPTATMAMYLVTGAPSRSTALDARTDSRQILGQWRASR